MFEIIYKIKLTDPVIKLIIYKIQKQNSCIFIYTWVRFISNVSCSLMAFQNIVYIMYYIFTYLRSVECQTESVETVNRASSQLFTQRKITCVREKW